MREDMFKVIVERPRRLLGKNHKLRPKGRWREELGRLDDFAWKRERIRQHAESICLNENLAPLRRFLESRAGRAWNDVFSEICEHLSVRSAVQKHVRDHLKDFVALHVERVDGRVRPKAGYRWAVGGSGSDFIRQPLYVDPDTGVLRANTTRRRRWQSAKTSERPRDVLRLDEWRELRRIDGLWFEVAYRPLPDATGEYPVWDMLERRLIKAAEGLAARGLTYAAHKRQLNSRELRRNRIENPAVFA